MQLGGLAVSLLACSVGPEYVPPTHFELVHDADVILLARAVAFHGGDRGTFTFESKEVLKGKWDQGTFQVEGSVDFRGRSDPRSFARVRPGAFRGGCVADDYRLDHDYVLFCSATSGRLYVGGPPFTRVNEEVDGEESPWTCAVATYARAAQVADPENRHEALLELLERARGGKDEAAAPAAMVPDLELYFLRGSHLMPWPELEALFRAADTARRRGALLAAMAECEFAKHGDEVKLFIRRLLQAPDWMEHKLEVARLVTRVPDPGSARLLIGVYSGEEEVARAIRATAQRDDMMALLNRVAALDAKAVALVAPLLARHSDGRTTKLIEKSTAELRQRIGKRYDEHWQETVALATLGAPEVVAFAKGILDGSCEGCCSLDMRILVSSPLTEADRLIGEIILTRPGGDLARLVASLDDSPWPTPWARIKQMVKLPRRDEEATVELRAFLGRRARDGDERARALLVELHRQASR